MLVVGLLGQVPRDFKGTGATARRIPVRLLTRTCALKFETKLLQYKKHYYFIASSAEKLYEIGITQHLGSMHTLEHVDIKIEVYEHKPNNVRVASFKKLHACSLLILKEGIFINPWILKAYRLRTD